ncbi:MAG TPA: GIY-YIG nuclease family protein [Candidatus Krumholzibacteria bacterium]|nr:GIY-YIG nuclease family protein [Candidatus Krumholzibacteria bacterium]
MPHAARRPSWFVYMVRCKDRTLYTGVSTDVKRRVEEHNDGSGARYTRSRCPVELVYREKAADRSAAQKREYEIKRMTAEGKQELVAKYRVRTAKRRPRRRKGSLVAVG